MKLYHLNVLIVCLILAFIYFENGFVMSALSSLTGHSLQIASVHLIYFLGVCFVLILAYLIRKQEA